MRFFLTGLSHRTAPVDVRERLAFPTGEVEASLRVLKQEPGIREGIILSTCNRVELAVTADGAADARAFAAAFLARVRQVSPDWLRPYLYDYEGRDAVRHLFRVASSLDSMVVGEPQILGQLKDAYAAAKAEGTVSGFLDTTLTRAFTVAKRVRTETEIGQSAVSISFAAVELAREIFGSLAGRSVLLVGAGKMSDLAARHLRNAGVSSIAVTNRTRERAEEMAALFGGVIIDYAAFTDYLPHVDIVITSSGAPHYILNREQMARVIRARRNRPVFIIDIAVPRNVEPAVNTLDNVFLYDIDDLQRVVETNRVQRRSAAEQAERIIDEEVARLEDRMREREVAPTITDLKAQLEQWRLGEIARVRGKLGPLTPQQEEAIEILTQGLVNKVAHGPITELRKHAGHTHGGAITEAIRRMFRLGG